jgi:signal transduction histidine kinase/ActR/RegA family two-component response regulator
LSNTEKFKVYSGPEKLENVQSDTALHGQNQVLEMLATGQSLQATLDVLIQKVESQIDNIRGSIFTLDSSGKFFLTASAPNLPEEVFSAFDGFEVNGNVGSCGPAVTYNKTIIVENIQIDPKWNGFEDFASKNQLGGCWSTPIRNVEGKVLGTFCCFFYEPRKPTQEEMEKVHFAAYLAGIAIQMKIGEMAKRESEERNIKSLDQLRSIMEGTASDTGDKFFHSLVFNLADSLKMEFACLGLLDGKVSKTLAFWSKDKFQSNFEYDISSTPCEMVIKENKIQVYPSDLQKTFPNDHILQELGIHSYLGVPLVNESKKVVGNLLVMDTKPMEDPSTAKMILAIFAARAEAELARKNAQEALLNGKKSLEKSSQAKTEFLSRMSHELRTPMNAILGFSQLLSIDSKEKLQASQKDCVDEIEKAGNHLLSLINEVLDLSKIESGQMTITPVSVELGALTKEITVLMEHLAKSYDVQLLSECDLMKEAPLTVFADRMRLKQVLLNLLSNGIKYNQKGGTVRIFCTKQETGNIRIHVKDTGKGIMANKLEGLYRPFDRLGEENSEVEGSGIGLTITQKLVELMDGKILVESELGVGSCFSIELPVGEVNKTDEPQQVEEIQEPDKSIPTVLYIEDNPANLALVKRILLLREEVQLLTAPEARLGLELARAHRPNLILMDINLPGMNGIEALKCLKTFEETKDIPAIAISAYITQEDIDKAMSAGFQKYLTKPIKVDEFLETIDKIIANGKLE